GWNLDGRVGDGMAFQGLTAERFSGKRHLFLALVAFDDQIGCRARRELADNVQGLVRPFQSGAVDRNEFVADGESGLLGGSARGDGSDVDAAGWAVDRAEAEEAAAGEGRGVLIGRARV